MRPKVRPSVSPPSVPPTRRAQPRTDQLWFGIIVFVLGATAAFVVDRVASTNAGSGTRAAVVTSVSPSQVASAPTNAGPTATASAAPSAAPSQAAPALVAEMPRSVRGTTLSVQSATGTTSLGAGPSSRAMSAALTSLGKKPADLEIAEAYDASGTSTLSILGFRVPGLDPTRLEPVILDDWLSANTPGVTTTSISLSGTPATRVSYGDEGASEYVVVHGDSIFIVETADQSLAASAVAALAAPSPSASPTSSSSPSASR